MTKLLSIFFTAKYDGRCTITFFYINSFFLLVICQRYYSLIVLQFCLVFLHIWTERITGKKGRLVNKNGVDRKFWIIFKNKTIEITQTIRGFLWSTHISLRKKRSIASFVPKVEATCQKKIRRKSEFYVDLPDFFIFAHPITIETFCGNS